MENKDLIKTLNNLNHFIDILPIVPEGYIGLKEDEKYKYKEAISEAIRLAEENTAATSNEMREATENEELMKYLKPGSVVASKDNIGIVDSVDDDGTIHMIESSKEKEDEISDDDAMRVLFDLLGEGTIIKNTKKNKAILKAMKAIQKDECKDKGEISDGYHTFNELYHQRAMLFAVIVKQNRDKAWKSFKHSDGKYCFDSNGEWFIVGIDTPEGSYTYHYEKKYWDLFECQELECGKEWDGHTEKDVDRLFSLRNEPAEPPKYHTNLIPKDAVIKILNESFGLTINQICVKINNYCIPMSTINEILIDEVIENCERIATIRSKDLDEYEKAGERDYIIRYCKQDIDENLQFAHWLRQLKELNRIFNSYNANLIGEKEFVAMVSNTFKKGGI